MYRKYYRPRSHHVEVVACGDSRADGDSTFCTTTKEKRTRAHTHEFYHMEVAASENSRAEQKIYFKNSTLIPRVTQA
ncbi:hypothetical protein HZH68_013726 [Vespula germanica]|uniref:Uncharacterized protein n=1 Tax=Vespula germanica TaxID=30212 RepID=A0A834JB68_VESGE|nr:hypothetical protein HZH68_013726 [Vespula germanica]